MTKSINCNQICYLFLCLCHSLISLIQLIYRYLNQKFNSNRFLETDSNDLVKHLTKIPKHIAICINEDLLNYKDLVNVINWCQAFGVRYLSLFANNEHKIMSHQLEKYLMSCPKNGFKTIDGSLTHPKNGLKNGVNGKSKRIISYENLNICIVSYEDSHQSIVKAAKHLCRQSAPIDQNDISLYLKKTFDFPDPELLIAFGESTALYGYPVWQLRLTELYFLPTHRRLRFQHFYEVLTKYSKCEQRFGK